MSKDIKKLKGKINQWVGVTTGDRGQEAKGVVERTTGREPTSDELAEAERDVKESHHDYGERVPPQEVPHHER